jgi:hypothetical protein
MDRLPTISVHLACTACRGTGFIDGNRDFRCHCRGEQSGNPLDQNLEALRDLIDFAYQQGYHEHGYDVLAETLEQLKQQPSGAEK